MVNCPMCEAPDLQFRAPVGYEDECLACGALLTEEDLLMLGLTPKEWSEIIKGMKVEEPED